MTEEEFKKLEVGDVIVRNCGSVMRMVARGRFEVLAGSGVMAGKRQWNTDYTHARLYKKLAGNRGKK